MIVVDLPMETCLEEPRKKYSKTGKKDMYKPYTGGRVVNIPYAIPVISKLKVNCYKQKY